MATDIFISYSRRDKNKIASLAQALEYSGKTVWWDPEILPGQHYQNVIQTALHEAGCVVTAWSENSVESDYVRAESLWAFTKKNLICASLDDTPIPTPFNAIQASDLTNWKGSQTNPEFQKLLRGVNWMCSQAQQRPDTTPPSLKEEDAMPAPEKEKLASFRPQPTETDLPVPERQRPRWPLLAGFVAIMLLAGYFLLPALFETDQQQVAYQPSTTTKSPDTSSTDGETPPTTATPDEKEPATPPISTPSNLSKAERVEALLPYIISSKDCVGDFNAPEVGYLKDYIHKAAAVGNLSAVMRCYELDKTLINYLEQNRWTPLHSAAFNNHTDVVEFLLKAGANAYAKDRNGKTPGEIASQAGAIETAYLLNNH